MRSLLEVVRLSKQYVNGARPDFEVEEWIASTLQLKRFDLYVQYDRPMEESELSSIKEGLRSLKSGMPLAYLLKKVYFWKSDFFVSPDVLIPRPETELLVEHSLRLIRTHGVTSVADICTGSGCIGLSIKKEIPSLTVCLVDIVPEALDVARKNATDCTVKLLRGDLLAPLSYGEAELVVCNPPYLSKSEYDVLDPSVRDFEPREAFIGGSSGLEMYERLVSESVQKGVRFLVLEIGATQNEAVTALCLKSGAINVELYCDLSGKDRVVIAQFGVERK